MLQIFPQTLTIQNFLFVLCNVNTELVFQYYDQKLRTLNKMKYINITLSRTVPKSNRKIVERDKIDTPNA